MTADHHVVIIGGGFGGLQAARSLKGAPVHVTLLDQRNFHLFQPLLYQVATGSLSPGNIASTLRAVLGRQKNARVLLAEAADIDAATRHVILKDGEIGYDTLIVATGSRPTYFGNETWRAFAPSLKTVEDATEIRRRILLAFEAAERETKPNQLGALLTFVIIGGGPTGVELAGALGEIAKDIVGMDFSNIRLADVSIQLIEGSERILPTFSPENSAKAQMVLNRLGVKVRTNSMVTDIGPERVVIKRGEILQTIPCRTVLWAAGMQASPLGQALAQTAGAKLDRGGRVVVEADLSLPNHPEIFVIGDLANYPHQTGNPLPGTAPVAIQQGCYVANLLRNRMEGKPIPLFHYRDRGNMAIIGRASAVAEVGKFRFSGFFAWLVWLFVHLIKLVEFENRVLVLIQWAWYYFTRNRGARLIIGDKRRV